MALAIVRFTASLRSSNKWATNSESRSNPNVNWVKSLEPMEKPSKIWLNSSASKTLLGNSHIT